MEASALAHALQVLGWHEARLASVYVTGRCNNLTHRLYQFHVDSVLLIQNFTCDVTKNVNVIDALENDDHTVIISPGIKVVRGANDELLCHELPPA